MDAMMQAIERIAREAGRQMTAPEAAEVYAKEGHANFVTSCDLSIQRYLTEALGELLPEAAFFGEESRNAPMGDGLTWVVDPIDGTLNFMHGRNASCVAIALLEKKQPIASAVYDPFRDAFYHARVGQGAYVGERRLRVAETPFAQAVAAFGTAPYNAEKADLSMDIARRLLRDCADIRRVGSAELDLCDVAAGRSDLFFELVLSPWDYAAGALLVTEAGGRFHRLDGALRFDVPIGALAAAPACFEPALQIIRAAFSEHAAGKS
ncbi:MAG TPA: inositol monophosphatase family protein [Clostridia bacterium]|nr:inositol monophosphatase family protein [Clostridia bacterium]